MSVYGIVLNSLHLDTVSVCILSMLYTFPEVLPRKICETINIFPSLWSLPSFSGP